MTKEQEGKTFKLTEKQQRFADEYIISLNATEAYLKAYGNHLKYNSAMVSGNKLLRNANIKRFVDERLGELRRETIATQEEVLELITAIARGETKSSTLIGLGGGEEGVIHDMAPTTAERMKAAELLGKRYAIFTDKQEINATVTPVFVDDIE